MKRNASTVEKMYQAVKKLSTFHSLNQQAVVSLSLLVYNSEHDHQTVEPQLESPVFSCLFSNLLLSSNAYLGNNLLEGLNNLFLWISTTSKEDEIIKCYSQILGIECLSGASLDIFTLPDDTMNFL